MRQGGNGQTKLKFKSLLEGRGMKIDRRLRDVIEQVRARAQQLLGAIAAACLPLGPSGTPRLVPVPVKAKRPAPRRPVRPSH
jgi:hypothetical protein